MEGLNSGLVVGTLLAIPLAIAANLLTPVIRRLIDSRLSKSKYKKRIKAHRLAVSQHEALASDLLQVVQFHEDQSKYWDFMLTTIIRATMYGALGGLYGGMVGIASVIARTGTLGELGDGMYIGLLFAGPMVGVVTSMLVFQVAWRALRIGFKLSSYEDYKNDIESRLAQLSEQISESSSDGSPANTPHQ